MSFIQMQDRLLRLPRFLRGLASTSFCLTRYVCEPHGLAFSDARQSLISAISASCVSTQLGWRCARIISQTKIGPAACARRPVNPNTSGAATSASPRATSDDAYDNDHAIELARPTKLRRLPSRPPSR
jgi:hypothetical protein